MHNSTSLHLDHDLDYDLDSDLDSVSQNYERRFFSQTKLTNHSIKNRNEFFLTNADFFFNSTIILISNTITKRKNNKTYISHVVTNNHEPNILNTEKKLNNSSSHQSPREFSKQIKNLLQTFPLFLPLPIPIHCPCHPRS